jgi:putative DNA primase/helicase
LPFTGAASPSRPAAQKRGAAVSAAVIAAALGDARREGRAWRCRCPLHGGRSLVLRDGDGGRLLATCWAGCDRRDLLAEVRRRGLLSGRADYPPNIISAPRRDHHASRIARALAIWRGARDGADTIARRYLASRGIELELWPRSLRFRPRCPRPKDAAGKFVSPLPAMVALVEHAERGPVGIHSTYLRPDGSGKADIERPKAIFGPVGGGAVRFGMPRAGEWLAVAEGIETALSVAVACAMPAWAALSAGGIKTLVLPAEATRVVICADRDASGTGERAAHDAAARWLAEGRRVRVAMPPEPGADFNDILLGRSPAKINGVPHGA